MEALAAEGIKWAQIDEPMLVTDLEARIKNAYREAYAELKSSPVKLMLTTYFDSIGDNLETAIELGTAGLHIDAVRTPEQLKATLGALKPGQVLSLGCVEGRNIWLTDFSSVAPMLEKTVEQLGADRVLVAPSCSLLHIPHDLRAEAKLSPRIKGWLRFAEEKLAEIVALANHDEMAFQANAAAVADREAAESTNNPKIRAALAVLQDRDFRRRSSYSQRSSLQRKELGLPLLPTTTIGSFPQTAEVRKHRAAAKHGHETPEQYEAFLKDAIAQCVREQERIGLDVLVHGEFKRNHMVEYFADFLDGFALTENGWVQSYGSRCVSHLSFTVMFPAQRR